MEVACVTIGATLSIECRVPVLTIALFVYSFTQRLVA